MSIIEPESLYKSIFDHALIAIGVTDTEGRFILVNNTWCSQLCYSLEESKLLSLKDILLPEDMEIRLGNFQKLVRGETDCFQKLSRYKRKDGSGFWTNLSVTSIKNSAGEVIAVLNIFQDIDKLVKTENNLKHINLSLEDINEHMKIANQEVQKKNEELQLAYKKLDELARTDSLTGLANRRELEERLLMESRRTMRTKNEFCICICDIDDFKLINDNNGHDVGDIVLKDLAELFTRCIRETDVVGRWGGEEFMFILPETPLKGGMGAMERVRLTIENYVFTVKDKTFQLTVTIGVSTFMPDSRLEDVIKQADLALYAGKKNYKNIVIQYTKQLEAIHSIYLKKRT